MDCDLRRLASAQQLATILLGSLPLRPRGSRIWGNLAWMATSLQTDAVRLVRGMAASFATVSARCASPETAVTPRFHFLTLPKLASSMFITTVWCGAIRWKSTCRIHRMKTPARRAYACSRMPCGIDGLPRDKPQSFRNRRLHFSPRAHGTPGWSSDHQPRGMAAAWTKSPRTSQERSLEGRASCTNTILHALRRDGLQQEKMCTAPRTQACGSAKQHTTMGSWANRSHHISSTSVVTP